MLVQYGQYLFSDPLVHLSSLSERGQSTLHAPTPPSVGPSSRWLMVSNTSNAANVATAVPIRTSTVMALLSSKLNSHGVAMSHSPATKLSHSSQTAKAASAAIDSSAIKRPMIDAVCRGAPADKLNSQGEKNRIVPSEKFTMSKSLALDHSSMTSSHCGFGYFIP